MGRVGVITHGQHYGMGGDRLFRVFFFFLDRSTGAASIVFSYLRVDLKDIALGGEKRRESCELLADGAA